MDVSVFMSFLVPTMSGRHSSFLTGSGLCVGLGEATQPSARRHSQPPSSKEKPIMPSMFRLR